MTCPSYPLWFGHPNIWWIVLVMKLLIMQSSPVSCHNTTTNLNELMDVDIGLLEVHILFYDNFATRQVITMMDSIGQIYYFSMTYVLLTNSMDQSSFWEVNSHSDSQRIPCLLCNQKVHYRVHKNPPLVTIMSQIHSDQTFPHYIPMIHPNIIFPPMPRYFVWSLPFTFSNKNFVCVSHLSRAWYMLYPSHPLRLDHPNNFWGSYKLWSCLLCILL